MARSDSERPAGADTGPTEVGIAVLGGGPIGLAAALLLARTGFACAVFDARALDEARRDRRLLALSRGTWQVLAPLLGAQLPPQAPILDVHVSSAGEFGMTHIGSDDVDGAPDAAGEALGATVYYGDLLDALARAVAAQPSIRMLRPLRVAAVSQRYDGIAVEADDGRSFSAALAIHAEGAPAKEAVQAGPDAWAVLADLQVSGPVAGAAYERFTRDGPLALLPAPSTDGPRWSLVWCMDETAAARRAALDDAAFRGELQRVIGPRIARVVGAGPRRAVRLPQQTRSRVVDHRTAWLGNAAQTLHPVAGQGFNLGLRDCATLADCLARSRDDLPTALADYAHRRARDRELIGRLTRWMPPLFATRLAPVGLARSLGLTALDLLPPLRRQWARLLMFGVRS